MRSSVSGSQSEVYDFIGNHLDDIPQHSIRYYVIAKEHKVLCLDWKKALLESWTHDSDQIDAERVVEMILADPSYKTDKERIEAFTAKTGRQRRQWYNLKKKVLKRKPGIGYSLQPQPSVPEEPSQSSNRSAPQDDIDLNRPGSIRPWGDCARSLATGPRATASSSRACKAGSSAACAPAPLMDGQTPAGRVASIPWPALRARGEQVRQSQAHHTEAADAPVSSTPFKDSATPAAPPACPKNRPSAYPCADRK